VETVGALEDFSGDQQPAIGCQSPRKRQTKDDVVRGTPKGWTFEKRRRTQLKCSDGVRDRDLLCLGIKENVNKALRQTIELEIIKQVVRSSFRIHKMSVKTLWRSRPRPNRKKGLATA
jgi:hypothetical protein